MTTNLKVAATNEIKIEKGVPIPDGRGMQTQNIYPWDSMDIGDSFAVPPDVEKHFRSQAKSAGYKHNRKFTVRKCGEGYRCWRIA